MATDNRCPLRISRCGRKGGKTSQGTSFPRPNQFHAHGYVNEMNDAVECALNPHRVPQSGPLMTWDTMAVLMAAYESSEKDGAFVELSEYIARREFLSNELPDRSAEVECCVSAG